jgi:Protein of unknown function (DUF3143)
MVLPPPDTILYNHPLSQIDQWLLLQNCIQDSNNLSLWYVQRPDWKAEIYMDTEEVRVRYVNSLPGNKDTHRAFPYSLSRRDIENAIFTGP